MRKRLLIGLTYGAVSGFAGGWLDNAMMRFLDALYGLPHPPFAIITLAIIGTVNCWTMVIALSITSWFTGRASSAARSSPEGERLHPRREGRRRSLVPGPRSPPDPGQPRRARDRHRELRRRRRTRRARPANEGDVVPSAGRMSGRPPVDIEFDVRLVPISVSQIRALESLQRAFSGLASDFEREYGRGRDEHIAGGLFLLWSTLDIITTLWKEAGDDVATVERWRAALEEISAARRVEDARAIAREALDETRAQQRLNRG
jgi:hypothetical protein